ncbi:MAG: permease-like cell division protein FtsX [Bacteroidota bacterium]
MSQSPFKTTRGNWASAMGTIVGITLTLVLLGILCLLALKGHEWQAKLKESLVVQVFLDKEVQEGDIQRVQKWIESEPYSKEVTYISPQKATEIMEEQLQEPFVEFLGGDPVNASFDVALKSTYANLDSLEWIEKSLSEVQSVEQINYPRMELENIETGLQKIMIPVLVISGLLLFIAVAIINLTIRLSIFSKRFLIKSMQLVGATKSFIRRPFIMKVVGYGIISSLVAFSVLVLMLYGLKQQSPEFFDLPGAETFVILFGWITVFGIFISWIATHFAVNKYLRLRQDQLY